MWRHSPHHTHARDGEISDLSTSVMWRNWKFLHMWRNRFLPICHIQKSEISPHEKFLYIYICGIGDKYGVCSTWPLVVKTFKNSTAERVPSECSQLRYTSDILEYLFKSTAERVPSECSQVRYTCDIFLWLHKAFCSHASRVEVNCGMISKRLLANQSTGCQQE